MQGMHAKRRGLCESPESHLVFAERARPFLQIYRRKTRNLKRPIVDRGCAQALVPRSEIQLKDHEKMDVHHLHSN